jgi:hypothetical protein
MKNFGLRFCVQQLEGFLVLHLPAAKADTLARCPCLPLHPPDNEIAVMTCRGKRSSSTVWGLGFAICLGFRVCGCGQRIKVMSKVNCELRMCGDA